MYINKLDLTFCQHAAFPKLIYIWIKGMYVYVHT